MTLEFTAAAISDLQSIREYTLRVWSEEQEQIYLDGLWEKFGELVNDPDRWRSREDLFPGCRLAVHEKHVILFALETEILQIVRILHGSMDLPRHLLPD